MEEIMARHNTAFLNSIWQMMVGVLAQVWTNILIKVIQVMLLLVNHLVKMQVFNRLRRVQVFNQLSMWIVNQFGRSLIKQYQIHAHMEKWHSALLEFNLSLLTG
jgi:hypothetical protein